MGVRAEWRVLSRPERDRTLQVLMDAGISTMLQGVEAPACSKCGQPRWTPLSVGALMAYVAYCRVADLPLPVAHMNGFLIADLTPVELPEPLQDGEIDGVRICTGVSE